MLENEALNTLHILLAYEKAVDAGELNAQNQLYSQEKEALQFILEEIQQYRAIGTIDELKALKEKSFAKKAVVRGAMGFDGEEAYYCPNCNERLYTGHFDVGYCNCGQSLKY